MAQSQAASPRPTLAGRQLEGAAAHGQPGMGSAPSKPLRGQASPRHRTAPHEFLSPLALASGLFVARLLLSLHCLLWWGKA